LVEQPFAIYVALPFHGDIHQLKRCALPKIIAGVDKFVDAAVEPTLNFKLTLTQPLKTSLKVNFVSLIQQ